MIDSRKNWQNNMPLENKTCTFESRDMNNTSTMVMLTRVVGEILASNNSSCTLSKNYEKIYSVY